MSYKIILEKLESIESLLKMQTLLQKKVLSFKEAMYVLGMSKTTLYDLMRKKKIPCYRPVKGKVFFIQKELKYWIMAHSDISLINVEKLDHGDSEINEPEL